MLRRLMPRVERLCSIALVAGGRMPSAPRKMSAELKLNHPTKSSLRCVGGIFLLSKVDFERSGRGQEPSRGHKFSILENLVLHRDFTSTMRLHFRSVLVGVALVGATPLHLLSQTALPLKSPTGAFIAALRCANAVPPKPCSYSHLAVRKNGVSCLHNFTEELSNRQEVQ